MTDKQIIIDVCPYQGECSVSGCKRNDDGCFVRQLFEERYRAENQIVDLNKMVETKEQECERLKNKLNPKLKNAHCTYFEGQTGLCKAKEFTRCNPVGCKLYTIDELSTIVDLQQQLDQLKAENKELKKQVDDLLHKPEIQDKILWKIDNEALLGSKDAWIYKLEQTLTEIKGLSQSMTDEFEEMDIEQQLCYCQQISKQILQKISECEVGNG